VSWSVTPGEPAQLVRRSTGFALAGTFLERLDLGGSVLESSGCADGFVAAFDE
jgi:hypothetical protein